MSSSENFNAYSRYYDLLYKDKNYTSEANYVVQLIKANHNTATQILELGCGTGNHAAILCKEKYSVTGLERSAEMVELAKQKKIENFEPIVADITNFSVNNKFDVAVSLFHVISYLTSNNQLVECFNTVNKHLNEKGIFIFDVWYTPAVYMQKPETRVKRISDNAIQGTRIAESTIHFNKNVVDVNYEIHIQNKANGITEVHQEKHPMRHFSIPEIALLADLTNFTVIKTEEFGTQEKPSENTWGVCFVLQKK
jgi:SAM-dependent methyltransferase